MQQFTFNLDIEEEYNYEDYIVSTCNIDAYNLIHKHTLWSFKRLLLIGEEGSGKTHLCNIWSNIINAEYIAESESFEKYKSAEGLILENIERVSNEEYIFHLINFCQNNSIFLLLTAQELGHFKLPDLQSRINATQKVVIRRPDDALLRVVLNKYLSDRQLSVQQDVCDFILSRAERSFAFIKQFVNQIDFLSLSQKRNITIPLVKKVLEEKFLLKGEYE